MLRRHVTKLLSAHSNQELSDEDSRGVAQHLLVCSGCRREYEQIRAGAEFAKMLAPVQAPDGLWGEIERSVNGHGVARETQPRKFRLGLPISLAGFAWLAAAVAVAGLLVTALVYLRWNQPGSWRVARLDGAPRIESEPISPEAKLKVGQFIETDQDSRARLYPGAIGEVEVEPGSKLRLIQSQSNEYRLSLEHGEVKAKISAPPRLFFVDTPSAVAVDLGCAYTLDVDPQGGGRIDVTSGWVEFDSNATKSMVPAEAACITRPGAPPGTPFFEDASDKLKDALRRFDFGENTIETRESALSTVLTESRKRDSLTLWHLLSRVGSEDRVLVYRRLSELIPPPLGASAEATLRLDPKALELWFMEIQPAWFE